MFSYNFFKETHVLTQLQIKCLFNTHYLLLKFQESIIKLSDLLWKLQGVNYFITESPEVMKSLQEGLVQYNVLGTIGRKVGGRVITIQTDQYKRHLAVLVGAVKS